MRLSERLGFGPQQHLFPRIQNTEHDDDLTRWTVAGPIALNAWLKETFDRKRSLSGVFSAFTKRDEPWLHHVLEGIEFVGRMDIADRASNGLRRALQHDNRDHARPSEFGTLLTKAYDNPAHSDHNHEHNRRHERWLEAMMLNIPELRHSHSIFQWIDSAMLFSYFHDIDQLMSLERNLAEGGNLSVKKGHGPAAAVMLLVLHKRYAVERKVSIHQSWEICAGAALMILKHDEPEMFAQAMAGMKSASFLHGYDLVRSYEKNELDLFTISPSQLIKILRDVKSRHGFISDTAGSQYGLYPTFEKEYAQELTELESNDFPILKEVTPEQKISFRHAAEAAVLADVFDMDAPPVESIFRLLNTQYSRSRPFFRADEDPQLLLDNIFSPEGNLPLTVDSDARRLFWQFAHMEHVRDSIITESTFVQRINREHALLGALAVKDIGARVMRGDFTPIDRVYRERKSFLARKTLTKANVPRPDRLLIYRAMQKTGNDQEVVKLLIQRKATNLLNRYLEKIKHLEIERASVEEGLRRKPRGSRRESDVYSDEEVRAYETIADTVIERLCEKYQVTPKQLRRYQKILREHRYPDITPYVAYDSLGGVPRTLVTPLP